MALPLYLAMTAAELGHTASLPSHTAFMACHFSPGGPGLSNFPERLPQDSILILDDSTPFSGHDPERIGEQLREQISLHHCSHLLLDFERPGLEGQRQLTEHLLNTLPCPVAVSSLYARELDCPVFLPPVPPDIPLRSFLASWENREIWLDTAPDALELTLTDRGCTAVPLRYFSGEGQRDDNLHCHYCVNTFPDKAVFYLWRTRQDLADLLTEAQDLGITAALGLWQELGDGTQITASVQTGEGYTARS